MTLRRAWGAFVALACAIGCDGGDHRVDLAAPAGPEHSAPAAADRGDVCADVGASRVCWGAGLAGKGCDDGICATARPVPSWPAPPSGWRCRGHGASRTCAERAMGAAPFVCEEDRCVQAHPREPDDGEWECVEMNGAVVCRHHADAAGIAPGPSDAAWLCGAGRRVCVDFAPDLPGGAPSGWRCRFDYEPRATRACVRDTRAPVLGGACGADAPACPSGARCVAGRCAPERPSPSCWVDRDCDGEARCVFGTCAS